jgi:hypothetical protein
MISPLQTWQHPQPKRLWWILGGLSVLAHVGVLGLSLPYVLALMQPSGPDQSAIPIEFVAVAPAEVKSATEPAELPVPSEPQATLPSQAEADTSAVSDTEAPTSSVNESPIASRPAARRASHSPVSGSSPANAATPSAANSTNSTSTDNSRSDNNGTDNGSGDGLGDGLGDGSDDSGTQENTDDRSDPAMPDSSDSGNGEPSTGEPSTLEGETQLPEPVANSGGTADQAASLTIVGSSEVPEDLQRDIADTPPRLISDTGEIAAIAWQPQSIGCGRVDFAQSTGIYKMTVNADGTLDQATLWTDGSSRAVSESEAAIACLLESADLRFEPAQRDGQPVRNDNLLLTVQIIERQPE